MENIKLILKSKAFIYIALLFGFISMLLIGQEKQYGIFAWLAPLFLLQFSRRAKLLHFLYLFILLIVAGYITQKTHNLFNDPALGVINGVAYALVHSIIYLTDRLLYLKGKDIWYTFLFPTVYVVIEALITAVLGTSGVLAISQFSFTPLAQFSSVAGIHGITFLICWFASVLYWLFENDFKLGFVKRGLISLGIVYIIVLGFGFIRMTSQPNDRQEVKVATISGTFDLHKLAMNEKNALLQLGENPNMKIPDSFFSNEEDLSVQIENTRKAALAGAKLIVWNEAALFLNQKQLPYLIEEVRNIANTFNAYILLAFFEENNSSETKPINNKSILITNDGSIGWEYKKSRLTPAEIPLVNPGNSIIPTFDSEYGRIANVICYDYDFPGLLKQANKNKVDIMLVPAYDWEGFASLHSKMAQFETLQSGRLLIRSNGNGINIVTNGHGKVISELNTFTSNDRILYADLPINSSKTIYSKTGNLFVMLCFVVFVLSMVFRVVAFVKLRKKLVFN